MRALGASRTSLVPGGALAGGWTRNALWKTARAVPSLDLRFADNKSLVDAVTGASLVTITRASSGTFVDSAGVLQTAATDVPRFDHNPTTGESLGLLVEEPRTNNLTYSEDTSQWLAPTNVTLSQNQTTAPTGALTADQYIETATTGLHVQDSSAFVFVTGTTYTYSVYVKPIGGRNFEIGYPPTIFTGRFARFSLSGSGSVQGTDAGVTASIQAARDGWYRCSATNTCAAGAGSRIGNFINNASFSRSYTGDTAAGLSICCADLQAGAFPTSYIPTTTAAATRSASLADLISSAIANNICSFYVEFSSPAVGTRGAVSLNDNTANERADLLTSGTDPRLVVHDGGAEQTNIDGGTVTAGVRTRIAVRINTNDFAISINGGAVATDTSGTLPTVDRLMFGRTQAGEYLNGRIARFTGWTGLLPDSTLQALTQ